MISRTTRRFHEGGDRARTDLHPSRSGDIQFLPHDSNHFAFEAGGVVLLGFVAEVRQQVKVFRVVRPFLLDVFRASSSPMQRRPTGELVSQDLRWCLAVSNRSPFRQPERENPPRTHAWPCQHERGDHVRARSSRDAGASRPRHAASYQKPTASESVVESRSVSDGADRCDHVAARRPKHPRSRWAVPW